MWNSLVMTHRLCHRRGRACTVAAKYPFPIVSYDAVSFSSACGGTPMFMRYDAHDMLSNMQKPEDPMIGRL